MAQITVNTGMDTRPIIQGAGEIDRAIRSLKSAVGKIGKDLDASVVGYIQAYNNSITVTQNFRERMDELRSSVKQLRSQLVGMAATRVQTPEFKGVLSEIQQVNNELKQLEKEEKALAAENAPALVRRWEQISARIEKSREGAEKFTQNIERLKAELVQVNQALQSGTDENGGILDDAQIKKLKKQKTKIQNELSFADMLPSADYQTYTSSVRQMNEMIARGDDELVRAYQKNTEQISNVMSKRDELFHRRDDMMARGTDTQLGIDSSEYKAASGRLDELNAQLAYMTELENNVRDASADLAKTPEVRATLLGKDLSEAYQQMASLTQEAYKLNDELSRTSKPISEQEAFDQLIARKQQEAAELDKAIDDLDSQIQDLQGARDGLQAVGGRDDLVAALNTHIIELSEKYNEMVDEFNNIQDQISGVTDVVPDAEYKNAVSAEADYQELATAAQEATQQAQEAKARYTELLQELHNAPSGMALESADTAIDTLKAKIDELQAARDKVAKSDDVDSSEIEKYDQQIKAATNALRMFQSERDRAAQQLEQDKAVKSYDDLTGSAKRFYDAIQKEGRGGKAEEGLEKELAKTQTAYDNLIDKQQQFVNSGGDVSSPAYKKLQQEVDQTANHLAQLKYVKEQALKAPDLSGWNAMPTLSGTITKAFQNIQNAAQVAGHAMQHPAEAFDRAVPALLTGLANVAQAAFRVALSFGKMVGQTVLSALQRLGTYALNAATGLAKMAGSAVISFLKQLANAAKNAATQLAKITGNALSTGLKGLGSVIATAGKQLLGLGKSAKRSNGGLASALKMVVRYGLGVRSTYMLVRKLRSALTEAFQNMAKQVPEVNKSLSALVSSLDLLKNSLATAFQPILTVVTPILVNLMDTVSGAMNKVGEFFAVLTGQNYIYKATKAQIDYAASLDKTKKKAKEAENQLAGFDHLNILKDNKSDDTEDPTATFEKVPVKAANSLAEKLRELFNKGDFAGIGKLLAEKLWELIEGIDFAALGKKIGEWINHIVDIINNFFDNFPWEELGAKLAEMVMNIIDTVDPYELGRLLTQKIRAIIKILWGFVNGIKWEKVGKFIADMLWGAFNNIPWEMLADLIAKSVNGILTAIYTAAELFPWGEAGERIANALRIMIMGIDIEKVYRAFRSVLIGILDFITPILKDEKTWKKIGSDFGKFLNNFFQDDKLWAKVRKAFKAGITSALAALSEFLDTFEFGKNGKKFGKNVGKMLDDLPDNLGEVLVKAVSGALEFLIGMFSEENDLFTKIGDKFGTWLFSIFENKEIWDNLGEFLGLLIQGSIRAFQTFFDKFNPQEAANNVKSGLSKLGAYLPGIASDFWSLVKTAFSKAGSFVDALFSEAESPDMSFEQLEAAMNFNKMSIGARIGAKLRNALIGENGIPWSEIASDLWEAAKTAFTITGDFVGALLGVDTAGMDAEQRIKAIAFEVGNKLAGLPWNEIFATAFQTISDVLKSLIAGLLGNEGGNGQVLLWIVGGLLAVKAGIIPAIAKLIAGLAAAIFSSGPALATAITLALGAMATAGVIKLASVTIELVQAQKDLNDALDNVMDTGLSNYVYLWKTKGADAANEFARQTYQIELTGNDMEQNMQLLGQRIADVQGTTFNNVNTIVDTALGTYKTIVRTQGEEAAKEWALNALDIELTGDSTAENMKQLGETIEQYAGNSKDTTKRIVDEACSGITGSVTTTTTDVESTVSTSTGNIEGTVEGSTDNIINTTDTKGKEIGDNLVSPYSDSLPDIQTLTSQMEAAVNSSTGDMLEDVKTNMNEESRVYSDNMNSISNETSTKWNEAANAQETKLGEMSGDLADSLKGQKDEITTGKNSIEEQTKPIYDKWKASNWLVKTALGTMESNVSTAMTNMVNTVKTNMETLETNVKNVMSSLSNANWSYIGEQICNGINQGIHNGWQPLIDACWYLARDMYDAARRALDIRSPSHLFEKGIGLNVGLGIANGITDSEPAIMDSVSDLANLANETMNDAGINGEFKADGTGIVDGLDGVLTTFSDRVQSSFTDMLTKLNAIAETVSFRTPKFAAGTVLPYSVAGKVGNADNSDVSDTITMTNEELISVIIQSTNNLATTLVRAIEQNSNNSTDRKINTDSIIDEINRRTRAMGKSPLLI